MSTHNNCFYSEMLKLLPRLSSDVYLISDFILSLRSMILLVSVS